MRQPKFWVTSVMICLAWAVTASADPEAFEIGPHNTDRLPGGKEADGIIGDFVLRNDRVEVVISGDLPLRRANMSTFYGAANITPGCLYDLTLRGANNDQITYFGPAALRGEVSHVRITSDGFDGMAAVETHLSAAAHHGLETTHEYMLQDGWQGVVVASTFSNRGDKPIEVKPKPDWKGLVHVTTVGDVTTADAQNPFHRQAYAYRSFAYQGAVGSLDPFMLGPGESRKVVVALAVGRSPAEAYGVVAQIAEPSGTLRGRLIEKGDGPVPVRAVVDVLIDGKKIAAYPNDEGDFTLALRVGTYTLTARDHGRPSVTRSVTIREDEETDVRFVMNRASAVRIKVVGADGGPIPCKVQFNGVDGTKTPNLGPGIRADGCDHQYHSANGSFTQHLDPGTYEVIITHGIEFDHHEERIEVRPGRTTTVDARLRRIVDTRGWVSTDFHNHSTPSGDNYCGTDDRIINLAAEHIEFAPTTEHNRMYDWKPHIDKLGLSQEISTVIGIELTGSGPHLNSFPQVITPFRQDNGAPIWNPDARISALTLRFLKGAGPSRWVHLNHPDVARFFADRDGDGKTDGGFTNLEDYIDAAETWSAEILNLSPKYASGNRENRTFAWLQMLNQGRRMWCIAVSDAHAVFGNGVGGWRTYVPSSVDEPARIDPKEIIRNAKAGKLVVTTGPFLEVQTDDGTMPGGTTIAAGHVDLRVRVQCNTWIGIDKVVVLVNARPGPGLTFTRAANPEMFGDGVVQFDRTIRVPLSEDAHLIVVATSDTRTLETGYGRSPQSKLRPIAYNNPIFVDVDHNGWQPNGDTLGHPLLRAQ